MTQPQNGRHWFLGIVLGALALLTWVGPAWAVYGHWHRVARRHVVAGAATSSLERIRSSERVASAPAPTPTVNADAERLLIADLGQGAMGSAQQGRDGAVR